VVAADVDPYGPGHLVGEKYLVERRIGEGGMGQVLLARHTELDRNVAIKILRADLAKDASAVERFLREARAAARIESDHVVHVFDVGRFVDGRPYIVMEYLEGEDLGRVAARGALPVASAVEYVLHACEGVAEAHRMGVIHRDLKPENLFLARRRDGGATLKVVDFGISKLTPSIAHREHALTTGELMGTPFYMSPEQLQGAAADERSDVWALGVILFELVTASAPFEADTLPALCLRIMNETPRRISQARPDLAFPFGLEEIVDTCLAKNPADRYAGADALAVALAPFAPSSDESTLLPMRGRVASVAEGPPFARSVSNSFVRRRRRWGVVAAAAATAALVGVASFVVLRSTREAPTPASVTLPPVPVAAAPTVPTASAPPEPTSSAGSATPQPTVATAAPSTSPRSSRPPPASQATRPAPTKPPPDGFGGRL
jgi:serine/threonine protein kinase